MRRPTLALAVLLAAPLLAATPPAHAAGTLRIGLQDDPDALDPAQAGTYAGRIVFASLCDKLVDIDANLNIVPQLATAWRWSEDAKSLTFTLRQGVTFHDGAPFDAEAVKANLDRYRTAPESVRKPELKSVTAIEIIDPHTIRLDLGQPFAPLLAVLSDRSGMMLSPRPTAASGRDTGNHPVCSGPFRFTERVALDHITLDRFPGYWNAPAITLDRVIFRPINDSTVRFVDLQGGQLDMIEEMAPSDVARARADAKLRVLTHTSLGYETMSINTGHAPGDDNPFGRNALVRAAFEAAIDRNIINQVALEGLFVPDNQSELPDSRYYDTAHPTPARDIERARALMKQAGVDHVTVTLRMVNTPRETQIGEIMQSMLAEAGITLKLLPSETNTMIDAMNRGDYQAALTTWSGRADPDFNISLYLASDGSQNWGRYANPAFDDLLARARTATDPAIRAPLYHQAAALYLADRPHIFLFHNTWLFATTAKLHGFSALADGLIRPQGLSIDP
jgi:peptide/nickel transport system substrate-binding protein